MLLVILNEGVFEGCPSLQSVRSPNVTVIALDMLPEVATEGIVIPGWFESICKHSFSFC
jgi:hypothetical protein